jgi:hypothetical protein
MSSDKKKVSYRFQSALISMIKETSLIMNRSEADTVRILLWNGCKYWITKNAIKKPTIEKSKVYEPEEDIEELLATISHLK